VVGAAARARHRERYHETGTDAEKSRLSHPTNRVERGRISNSIARC
jgi:hypothetical protein